MRARFFTVEGFDGDCHGTLCARCATIMNPGEIVELTDRSIMRVCNGCGFCGYVGQFDTKITNLIFGSVAILAAIGFCYEMLCCFFNL
jgi:MinD superfamily P-loop ATPase